MDSLQAIIIFLDELVKHNKALAELVESQPDIPEAMRGAAESIRGTLTESITTLIGAVKSQNFDVDTSPIVEAVNSSILANAGISRLTGNDLAQQIDRLIESNNQVIQSIESMRRPRKWKLNLKRHQLGGHIIDAELEAVDG